MTRNFNLNQHNRCIVSYDDPSVGSSRKEVHKPPYTWTRYNRCTCLSWTLQWFGSLIDHKNLSFKMTYPLLWYTSGSTSRQGRDSTVLTPYLTVLSPSVCLPTTRPLILPQPTSKTVISVEMVCTVSSKIERTTVCGSDLWVYEAWNESVWVLCEWEGSGHRLPVTTFSRGSPVPPKRDPRISFRDECLPRQSVTGLKIRETEWKLVFTQGFRIKIPSLIP